MRNKRIIDLRNKPAERISRMQPAPVRMREKPVVPLRTRRRRTRFLVTTLALSLCALGAYGLHVFSYAPAYSISEISIEGTETLSPALVRAYAQTRLDRDALPFLSPRSIFFYDRKSLARGIVDFFPRIESAEVSRASLLSTVLIITVKERSPSLLWCGDEQCFTADETGLIFAVAQASSTPRAMPYTFGGGVARPSAPIGQYIAHAHFAGILALLRLLGQVGLSPHAVRIENENDLAIYMAEGFFVRSSFGQDAPALVRNLKLVLSSDALTGKTADLEYIDLRFGDRVYFKLKGDVASSTSPVIGR